MSRLSERELALLLARIRESHPQEAARIEAHLEAAEGQLDFLHLFERILTSSNELGQLKGGIDAMLREISRWADAQEAANEAEKTSLELQRDSIEHEQTLEQAQQAHSQAIETLRAEHDSQMKKDRLAQWGKLGGALVGGGGLAEIARFLIERLGG